MLKDTLSRLLKRTPLHEPARRAYLRLKASGYAPWQPLVAEEDFRRCILAAIRELQQADPRSEIGDYLEFGVSRGTSLASAYKGLTEVGLKQVRLIGFDSFQGLPPEAVEQGWAPGTFASTIKATQRYLRQQGVDLSRVDLVPGWFEDTLNEDTKSRHALRKASLIMMDCDIYSATRTALWFCESLITDQAVILFDDWGWREERGEIGQKEAFAEFLAEFSCFKARPVESYFAHARAFHVSRR